MCCNEIRRRRMDSSPKRRRRAFVLTLLALACIANATLAQSSPGAAHQQPSRATTNARQSAGEVKSLERVTSRNDFDRLARIYYRGRFYALPHIMFVIDRRDHDRVYYVNSKRFAFHKDFV